MNCLYCGNEFTPNKGAGRPKKYCSDECRQSADRDNKRISYVGKRQKACIQCGKELPKHKTKFCSQRCARIHRGDILDHGEITKTCPICGYRFKTYKSQKITCSEKCSRIRKWRIQDNSGIKVDYDISLKRLAERDGNKCQICGEPVDWEDKQLVKTRYRYGDRYPSIDHIIPKSKGGLHSWENVQLAHIRCNSRKKDQIKMELLA